MSIVFRFRHPCISVLQIWFPLCLHYWCHKMSDTLKEKKKEANLWGLEWFWLNCSWVTFPFISHGSDALLLILLLLYKEFSVSVFIQLTIFQEMHNLDIFFSCFMWKYVYACVGGGGVGCGEVGRWGSFKSLQMLGSKLFLCNAVWHPSAQVVWLISSEELTFVIMIWGLLVLLCPES